MQRAAADDAGNGVFTRIVQASATGPRNPAHYDAERQ
jgi:hypothetical protein